MTDRRQRYFCTNYNVRMCVSCRPTCTCTKQQLYTYKATDFVYANRSTCRRYLLHVASVDGALGHERQTVKRLMHLTHMDGPPTFDRRRFFSPQTITDRQLSKLPVKQQTAATHHVT